MSKVKTRSKTMNRSMKLRPKGITKRSHRKFIGKFGKRSSSAGSSSGSAGGKQGGNGADDSAGPIVWREGVRPRLAPLLNSDPKSILVHVVPLPSEEGKRLLEARTPVTPTNVRAFDPAPAERARAVEALEEGRLTVLRGRDGGPFVTAVGTRAAVEECFGLRLKRVPVVEINGCAYGPDEMPFAPTRESAWRCGVDASRGIASVVFPPLVEFAAFANGTGTRAAVVVSQTGSPLRVPDELKSLLGVDTLHADGVRGRTKLGRRIHVVQIDSGLDASHPWFTANAGRAEIDDRSEPEPDELECGRGHGTQVAAVLLSVASEVRLTTLRAKYSPSEGRSVYDVIDEAVQLAPDVIVVPLAIRDLPDPVTADAEGTLDLFISRMSDAQERGIVVLFATGNHPSWHPPADYRFCSASAPSVISVGGADVRSGHPPAASHGTAYFASQQFLTEPAEDTYVPDLVGPCGLYPPQIVGYAPHWRLPVPAPAHNPHQEEIEPAGPGEDYILTWGGSSAAVGAVAGVAALVRSRLPEPTTSEQRRGTVDEVRRRLRLTTPVNDPGGPSQVRPGHQTRSGYGFVNPALALNGLI